jgi:hypothetical protein
VRQEQRCGEGLSQLTQNAGVGDANDRRARGRRIERAAGTGVRSARRSEEGRGPVAHTHTYTYTYWDADDTGYVRRARIYLGGQEGSHIHRHRERQQQQSKGKHYLPGAEGTSEMMLVVCSCLS